jgi:hypothetical protein
MPVRPVRSAGKVSKRNSLRKNKKTKKNMKKNHRGGNPERTYTNSSGASYTRPYRSGLETDDNPNMPSMPEMPAMPATGGAIYSFNLDDKIGGLPANVALNGTQDGDCPSTGPFDLGFTNYGLTKGGSYKKNKKNHKKNHKNKSKKNKKSLKSHKSKSRSHKK